jgi:hypothetical protein
MVVLRKWKTALPLVLFMDALPTTRALTGQPISNENVSGNGGAIDNLRHCLGASRSSSKISRNGRCVSGFSLFARRRPAQDRSWNRDQVVKRVCVHTLGLPCALQGWAGRAEETAFQILMTSN